MHVYRKLNIFIVLPAPLNCRRSLLLKWTCVYSDLIYYYIARLSSKIPVSTNPEAKYNIKKPARKSSVSRASATYCAIMFFILMDAAGKRIIFLRYK